MAADRAYRAGVVDGRTVRAAIARVAFTGTDAAPVDRRGRQFAKTVLPPLVRPQALARIDWHRECGDTVAVVSGGFDVYLAPWAAAYGLPVLASSLERRGGRLTGRYAGVQCVREEKVRRVRAAYDLSRFERVHAYGDSIEDEAMLAMADIAHFRRMPAPGDVAASAGAGEPSGA
ncbi:HAD-IB family phosphatase [Lysobacter xanthus]